MALFPNPKDVTMNGAIGKSHTGLVVSEGNAPAEEFIVSKTNTAEPFIYEYGPEGNQTVLIAKGKIVEAVGEEYNPETGYKESAIRVAPAGSERVIGVNHHNVYDRRRAAMEGNRPVVITRNYIEVPLFEHATPATAAASAKAMRFGAAYGASGELRSGDMVVAGEDGNFIKYVKNTHTFEQVIGRVLNVTRELPPAGLLQYYTGLKNSALDEYLKTISAAPSADGSIHPYGSPYTVGSWQKDFIAALGGGNLSGIPFLTDGYFSAREYLKDITLADLTTNENVEAIRPGDGATVDPETGEIVVDATVRESMVVIKLKHNIDRHSQDNIVVTQELVEEDGITSKDVALSTRDVRVDYINNSIILYLEGSTTYTGIKLDVPSVVNPTAGIPTEWDYRGSVGATRILLER